MIVAELEPVHLGPGICTAPEAISHQQAAPRPGGPPRSILTLPSPLFFNSCSPDVRIDPVLCHTHTLTCPNGCRQSYLNSVKQMAGCLRLGQTSVRVGLLPVFWCRAILWTKVVANCGRKTAHGRQKGLWMRVSAGVRNGGWIGDLLSPAIDSCRWGGAGGRHCHRVPRHRAAQRSVGLQRAAAYLAGFPPGAHPRVK